jgi:dihydroorotase
LRIGAPADVTVFAERPWRVDASTFQSLGKNTPFDGTSFSRRAIATIVGGTLVMRDGRILETLSLP